MAYRKNVEWFQTYGYPCPRTLSALLGMGSEVLQEVFEKKSTTHDDEVADVLLFRPAGMLLFT